MGSGKLWNTIEGKRIFLLRLQTQAKSIDQQHPEMTSLSLSSSYMDQCKVEKCAMA